MPSTIETRLSGSPMRAAPAQILVTLGAGHPKLRSMISAVGASISAAVAISPGSPPNICGINGTSVSWDSIFRHETAASRLNAVLFVNSVMVTSAPHAFASNRNGKSETPAIGARNNGRGSPSHGPGFGAIWSGMNTHLCIELLDKFANPAHPAQDAVEPFSDSLGCFFGSHT